MGRNKYRPQIGKKDGSRAGQLDNAWCHTTTDGEIESRQTDKTCTDREKGSRQEDKTDNADRQTDRGRRFLRRRLMGVSNARSHWHLVQAEVCGSGHWECKMMVSMLTSPLSEAAAGESDNMTIC